MGEINRSRQLGGDAHGSGAPSGYPIMPKSAAKTRKGDPYMKAALDEMDKINQNEKERYLYLREAMALSDEASRMATARKEGIREGVKQGISQGVQVVIQTCREFGLTQNDVQVKLETDFSISAELAKEYIGKFW